MAVEVIMPHLGLAVEKGKILKWLKSEADIVSKGEPIFEVEADKVTTEVESPASGILKKILILENIEVPVLTLLAIITDEGEDLPKKYKALKSDIAPTRTRTGILPTPKSPLISASSTKESAELYDIAIIGAGPGGYISAIRAAQMGARVLLVEKAELGGTCVNHGCIPTKCFLSDVKIFKRVRTSDVFANSSKVIIDPGKMVARKNQVLKTIRKGISLLLESQRVTVVKGFGILLDPRTVQVSSNGKTEVFKARHIIIATGSRVSSLPGVMIDGNFILSSDEALELGQVPEDILIIGGGVVGVEFAAIFSGLGVRVTIIEMLPQIISNEDDDVTGGLRLLMERDGIKILTGSKVFRCFVNKNKVEVHFQSNGKEEILVASKGIVTVGRNPNTDRLNVEKLGISMEGKFIKVNSRMETNVEGVYAIGDITGKVMLAHAASAEGIVAVENIFGKSREVDYGRIPSCIYTFPEVASVGLKEREAKQKGYNFRIGKFPYLKNGKALAINEPEGFVKIIAEEELGEILGVHILGESATDIIGECLVALQSEAFIEDLGEAVKGHPTLSELITEAALDWQKRAIHISPDQS